MSVKVTLDILNQKGTPAFYSDVFANRPAAGFAGRVFISTDTGAIYEDTGSTWTLIADAGAGTTGTLQQVTTNGNTTTQGIVISSGNLAIGTATAGAPLDVHGTGTNAQFNGTGTNNAYIFFQNSGANKWRIGNFYNAGANSLDITDSVNSALRLSLRNTGEMYRNGFDTISNTPTFASAGNYAINPSLVLSTPASSTFNSGGSWSGLTTSLLNSWGGNNTVPIGAVMAGFIGVARQSFDSAGATITVTQSTGNRAICGMQVLTQTGGANNGTISHGASLLVQGVYPTSGANITYTNYYGLLINQLDEYGGVTFTNRWGIYQGGANDKNYFAGNVGIGTTNIDLYSNIGTGTGLTLLTSAVNGSSNINIAGNGTGFGGINLGNSTIRRAGIYGLDGSALAFYTNTTNSGTGLSEAMRITSGGNVGIGTSSPNRALVVSGGNSEQIVLISSTTNSGISLNPSNTTFSPYIGGTGNDIIMQTQGSERMRITSGGYVGIGTSSPRVSLEVASSNTGYYAGTGMYVSAASGSSDYVALGQYSHIIGGGGTSNAVLQNNGSGFFAFFNNGSERMRITSGGNVLIGTTTDNGYKLQVTGNISASTSIQAGISLSANYGASNSLASGSYLSLSNPGNSYQTIFQLNASYGLDLYNYQGSWTKIATINATTGVYTPLSDINKKKDFEDSTIGLNAILGLKPKLYRMLSENDDVEKTLGFIAQEVKDYIPQAYVESGEDDNKFIGLTDRAIIAALVKAIQELNEKLVKNNIN